ncbi:MAG: response regulator [Rhodospirillales bacterium]|nr:response regulator [Rhodospirillales bacterium]MSP80377.1 response regulator [Rhodospirillales bacterium]
METVSLPGALPHLLVVDDDREIRDLLARFLAKNGFRVTGARDGTEMASALAEWRIDLVILDLMLPGEDGLALCRKLRASSALPVLMLTAKGEEVDRIVGLEVGADDYLPKPFNPRELLARVRAILRRAGAGAAPRAPLAAYRFAGFALDPSARRLTGPDGNEVTLTAGEYDLLVALVERAGRVLSRDQILDLTRGRAAGPFDRGVDIQISRLRHKIEANPDAPSLIKTVRGGGYVLAAPIERS